MTCIAALQADGRVYVAADGKATAGYLARHLETPKIFPLGPYVIGVSGMVSVTTALRHRFDPPLPPAGLLDPERFVATEFVGALQTCLETSRLLTIASGVATIGAEDDGARILVAFGPHVHLIESNFAVLTPAHPYLCTGDGAEVAYGALFATEDSSIGPLNRVVRAVAAARTFSAGCGGPISICVTDPDQDTS